MPNRYPKRNQHKYTKKPYRLRNWPAYESAVRKRGDLTLRFSAQAIETWQARGSGVPGRQRVHSDFAIETALTVRSVYHFGLRETEGFLRSVSTLLGFGIRIPDHSTLSRRSRTLAPAPLCASGPGGPVHILIDSTALKVHRGPEPRPKQPASVAEAPFTPYVRDNAA